MKYRKNKIGEDISILGFGCMRFTRKRGQLDIDKAEKEILAAYEKGVNYYDTAYIYPGSEVLLGQILDRNNIRKNVNIATKLPQYLIKSKASINKYFDEQKKRLKTDYIDYYLMHMLTDIAEWETLISLGIENWIKEKKASGEIRHIGFSFHGNSDMFIKILDAYDWDFCQIQYNYVDEHTQAGKKGLLAAAKKNIPVIIMEPLRGGKLVDMLPAKAREYISESDVGSSAAELAFKWLWNQPEVTCVLSGMNSVEMVEENVRTASNIEAGQLDEKTLNLIETIKEEINKKVMVECTACGYCTPCPRGVDIPGIFKCYNEMYTEKKSVGRHSHFQVIALRKDSSMASGCVGCGKCESHCPQHIAIIDNLKKADKALTPFPYKLAIALARWFLYGRKKVN